MKVGAMLECPLFVYKHDCDTGIWYFLRDRCTLKEVGQCNATIVGDYIRFGLCVSDQRTYYIQSIFVHKELRGNGYGRYLLEYVLHDLYERNDAILVALCDVSAKYRDSSCLYAKVGFEYVNNESNLMHCDLRKMFRSNI